MTPTPPTTEPETVRAMSEEFAGWVERNDARPIPSTATPTTPHGRLKTACRKALTQLVRDAKGRMVLVPIVNMRVKKRGGGEYSTGKRGASDDICLLTIGGKTLHLALEYKAGHDTQRPSQQTFEINWRAAGGVYLVVRDAGKLAETVRHLVGAA
jgi:hypothetical protein